MRVGHVAASRSAAGRLPCILSAARVLFLLIHSQKAIFTKIVLNKPKTPDKIRSYMRRKMKPPALDRPPFLHPSVRSTTTSWIATCERRAWKVEISFSCVDYTMSCAGFSMYQLDRLFGYRSRHLELEVDLGGMHRSLVWFGLRSDCEVTYEWVVFLSAVWHSISNPDKNHRAYPWV